MSGSPPALFELNKPTDDIKGIVAWVTFSEFLKS
jgi:hypothetical protein